MQIPRTRPGTFAALTAAVCLILGASAPRLRGQGAAVPRMITRDAVFVLRIDDITKVADQLEASALGKAATDSPVVRAGWNFLKAGGAFASLVLAEAPAEEFRTKTPKSWTLVVFDLPEDADDFTPPAVAAVAALEGDSKGFATLWGDQLLPGVAAMFDEWSLNKRTLGKATIYRMHNRKEDNTLYSACTESLAVFGNEKGVQKILECVVKPGEKLADLERYRAAIEAVRPSPLASVYIDLTPGISAIMNGIPDDSAEMKELQFAGTATLRTVTCSAWAAEDRFQEIASLRLDDRYDQGLLGILRSRQPIRPKSPAIVPANYGGHVAFSVTGGRDLFFAMQDLVRGVHGAEAGAGFDKPVQIFRDAFGVDLDGDILSRVGPEFFIAVASRGHEQWIEEKRKPGWKDFDFLFGIQVDDADAAQGTVRRIFESQALADQGFTLATQTFDGSDIHVVSHPNIPNGAQYYAFIGGFLVISPRQEALAGAFRAFRTSRALATAPRYRLGKKPFDKPVLGSLFLDATPILPKIVSALL